MSSGKLKISYESEGFAANGQVANGVAELVTSWNEVLWAAVTVGRPNRQYVFQHGNASAYEALFRWSLTRMALEQRSPAAYRLRRSDAAQTLDPSEKGAVSYFLGMTMAKLFSARLLNAPWVMHLDVFRPLLNPILVGRSRPDLVGMTNAGEWVVLESKGRISAPNADAKNKAKIQAERLISINGLAPALNIGAITYFRNDILHFFWRDPIREGRDPPNPIEVELADAAWRFYYQPVFDIVHSRLDVFQQMLMEPVLINLTEMDIQLGILPDVLRYLKEGQWALAQKWCVETQVSGRHTGYHQDGIRVVAGESWLRPFEEFEAG